MNQRAIADAEEVDESLLSEELLSVVEESIVHNPVYLLLHSAAKPCRHFGQGIHHFKCITSALWDTCLPSEMPHAMLCMFGMIMTQSKRP